MFEWNQRAISICSFVTDWNHQITFFTFFSFCETQPSSIQRLSSPIFPCFSFVVRPASWHLHLSPLYDDLHHTNHTFYESSWSKDIKTEITKCLMHKYTNTNTQIHKYSIWRSARKTQHVVYFWKKDCSRISKIIFTYVERTNTKKKYTNTAYDEVPEKPNIWYIFEKRIVQGYQLERKF